jgi:hypothetical protein
MVEPPPVISPAFKLDNAALTIRGKSKPLCSKKRESSAATTASTRTCGRSS